MAQKWSDKYPNGLQREKSSPSFPQHLILKEEKNDWNKLCPCNYTVTTNKTIWSNMINISHFYPRQVVLLIQSWWLLHVHTCKQYWWWKKKSLTKCFPAIQPLLNVPPYQCAKDQMDASGKYAEIFDSLKKKFILPYCLS